MSLELTSTGAQASSPHAPSTSIGRGGASLADVALLSSPRFSHRLLSRGRRCSRSEPFDHGKEEDFQLFLSLLDSDRFYGNRLWSPDGSCPAPWLRGERYDSLVASCRTNPERTALKSVLQSHVRSSLTERLDAPGHGY